MFFFAVVRLTSFGNLFGSGPLDVSSVALISTALVTMGAINAFNMLDGLDGLAGGVTLVATLLMMTQAGSGFHSGSAVLLFTLAGSITGFLMFNIPVQWNRAVRCFMGDAGSTLLGFSLAWLMIEMSQGPARAAAPVTMVWLVAIPATDLVWTVLRRLSRGRSPIRPDNEHMHHMLLKAGLGIRAVFVVMLSLAVLCGVIGLTLEHLGTPEWLSFALLICAGVLLVVLGLKASIVRSVVPARFHRRHVARLRKLFSGGRPRSPGSLRRFALQRQASARPRCRFTDTAPSRRSGPPHGPELPPACVLASRGGLEALRAPRSQNRRPPTVLSRCEGRVRMPGLIQGQYISR